MIPNDIIYSEAIARLPIFPGYGGERLVEWGGSVWLS